MPKDKPPIDENGPVNLLNNTITDAANQFIAYQGLDDIEEIRKLISETEFLTLEENSKKFFPTNTKKILEGYIPGICKKYDTLIVELKNPNLTYEQFRQILKKAWNLTHTKSSSQM